MSVGVPAAAGYYLLRQELPAGYTIQNQDPTNAVWLSDDPNVKPNNGIRLSAYGSVTWAQASPIYACVDTGVVNSVQLLLTDAVSEVTDPVALAAAVAIKLLNQNVVVTNQPTVGLAGGTAVGITGTPTVGLTGGTAVGITGTPTVGLAGGTAVGITGTPTVGLAAGTAVNINSGQVVGITGTPSVAVSSGTLTGIANTVNVAGVTKAELLAGNTLLSTLSITTPAGNVSNSANTGILTGFSQYSSLWVGISFGNAITPNDTDYIDLEVQFLSGSYNDDRHYRWYFNSKFSGIDYVQIPIRADSAIVTLSWSTVAALTLTGSNVFAYILGSYQSLDMPRYSQSGNNQPNNIYYQSYSAIASNTDWIPSINGPWTLLVSKRNAASAGHISIGASGGVVRNIASVLINAADPTFTQYTLSGYGMFTPWKIDTILTAAGTVNWAWMQGTT